MSEMQKTAMLESPCEGGPWNTIRHATDDHETRTVTRSYREGRDRGYAVLYGVYEWVGNRWKFREGLPPT